MRWVWVVLAGVLFIFAATVWPTMYRHDILHVAGGAQVIVKTNRFTGASYVFAPAQGWFEIGK